MLAYTLCCNKQLHNYRVFKSITLPKPVPSGLMPEYPEPTVATPLSYTVVPLMSTPFAHFEVEIIRKITNKIIFDLFEYL